MPVILDKDGRGPSVTALIVRGVVLLLLITGGVGAVLLKSAGRFEERVEVVALLEQLGDGLPPRSDVKFRGVLVGTVSAVRPATGSEPNQVLLQLDPVYAPGIPANVTARVVPSNLFAVSSVQLVDNGPAPALTAGAEIAQDRSLSTVQLQTALTKLRDILAASARVGQSDVVGVLTTVAEATDRRGAELVQTGAQLDRITREFGALVAPPGSASTLGALTESVRGLADAAPELLDTLHHAVLPMQALAEHEQRLLDLVGAGTGTLGTVNGGLERHGDQLTGTIDQFAPVMDVVAAGSPSFTGIVGSIRHFADKWFAEFWRPDIQNGIGKFQIRLSADTPYVRADCPRYGALEGPSCHTAPLEPYVAPPPPGYEPVAPSPELSELITRLLGGNADGADRLLGGLLGTLPREGDR
ncbi:MlaD family protein [Nocardia sp. NPDC057353]|uniref:MlaD family protein n=1 Tax=Nocardia sp. NPDC057353 TaxID=3346104 RepID=UPI00364029F4